MKIPVRNTTRILESEELNPSTLTRWIILSNYYNKMLPHLIRFSLFSEKYFFKTDQKNAKEFMERKRKGNRELKRRKLKQKQIFIIWFKIHNVLQNILKTNWIPGKKLQFFTFIHLTWLNSKSYARNYLSGRISY